MRTATEEQLGKHFRDCLVKMEGLLPADPKDMVVTTVNKDGIKGDWVSAPGARSDRVYFFSHGGGYVWGSAKAYHDLAYRLSRACKARVFLLDYDLAPGAQAPVQINQGLAAYDYVVGENPSADIVMGGDSAGGGLTHALAIAIRDSNRKTPTAIALIAPWVDLTGGGESMKENIWKDALLDPRGIAVAADTYRGTLAADDPRCSPLFAEQQGLPPVLLQVGADEILRDDSVRLEAKIRAAGGSVRLDIWPKVHHVWHFSARMIPEGRRAIVDIAKFFEPYWATAGDKP